MSNMTRMQRYMKGGTWFERSLYEAFFNGADSDRDGFISYGDLLLYLRKQKFTGSEDQIMRVFTETKRKEQDKMTYADFMAAMGLPPPYENVQRKAEDDIMKLAILRQVFSAFDKNSDGFIDKKELQTIYKELGKDLSDAEVKVVMAAADKDGSEKLDYEHFIRSLGFGKAKNAEKKEDKKDAKKEEVKKEVAKEAKKEEVKKEVKKEVAKEAKKEEVKKEVAKEVKKEEVKKEVKKEVAKEVKKEEVKKEVAKEAKKEEVKK